MNDPFALLKADHREAAAMLKQLAASKPGVSRDRTIARLDEALRLHMRIEEKLLYPLVAQDLGNEPAEEANNEHVLARAGLATVTKYEAEPGFGAAVAMLTAGIKHHVKEEESEMFAKMKRDLDAATIAALGDAVVAAKKTKTVRALKR